MVTIIYLSKVFIILTDTAYILNCTDGQRTVYGIHVQNISCNASVYTYSAFFKETKSNIQNKLF